MTTKIITSILCLALVVSSCSNDNTEISGDEPNAGNVFASLDYDTAVAYNYDGEMDIEIIDRNGNLAQKIKKQVILKRPQVTKLTNIFCSKSTYGGPVAACFDPHFGVVFYKDGKPKAYVSVCLDCNHLESSIKIPTPDEDGFSEAGAKNIYSFEKQVKLLE